VTARAYPVRDSMAFSISEVQEFDATLCNATVEHEGHSLPVMLKADYASASTLPPHFTAELDFTSVVRYEAELPIDDTQSGLFPTGDSAITLVDGSIHNHVEIDPEHVLLDVYIQNGPEFITLTSEDIGNTIPPVGTRIRAWVLGLTVYPTNT